MPKHKKFPFQYEIKPLTLKRGSHWLILSLKNISEDEISNLDLKLSSLDLYGLTVYGQGQFIASLKPNQAENIPFQIFAQRTSRLYLAINYQEDNKDFYWESSWQKLIVEPVDAELLSVYAISEPYPVIGDKFRIEASIRNTGFCKNLNLEFWVDTPKNESIHLNNIKIKKSPNRKVCFVSTDFSPKIKGPYQIHAYLFRKNDQIGHETDSFYAEENNES